MALYRLKHPIACRLNRIRQSPWNGELIAALRICWLSCGLGQNLNQRPWSFGDRSLANISVYLNLVSPCFRGN